MISNTGDVQDAITCYISASLTQVYTRHMDLRNCVNESQCFFVKVPRHTVAKISALGTSSPGIKPADLHDRIQLIVFQSDFRHMIMVDILNWI